MNFHDIEKKVLGGKPLTETDEAFIVDRASHYWLSHPDVVHRFPRWTKILAWIAGYQWVDYNRVKKVLQPVPYIKKRVVFNRLKPILRQMLAKVTVVQPQLGVVPNTNEYEDIAAARGADKLLEALSASLKFKTLRKEFFAWLFAVGRATLRVYWDESKKASVGYRREVVDGKEILAQITVDGDVAMEVVSPFNIRHDPLYTDPSKWRWVLFGELVDRHALAKAYDISPEELTPGNLSRNVLSSFSSYGISADDDLLEVFPSITPGSFSESDVCSRFELWTRNMVIVIAGNKVLEAKPNIDGIIPFFVYEDHLIPFDFYEQGFALNNSVFKDLLVAQKEYNRLVANLSSVVEKASKVRVMTPLGAMTQKSQILDDGSVVLIDYNAQLGSPVPLKIDATPPMAMPLKQDLEREMESLSGIHEVSFGRLPERASHASGALVSLLLEQDDSLIDPLVQEVDTAVFAPAWSYALRLVQRGYIEPRLLKVVGKDKEDSVFYFRGADLRDNTDVYVTTNLSMPKSRALRTEWILKMAQLGLITDPKLIVELLEFGEAKRIYEDQLLHERRALRENHLIERGEVLSAQDAAQLLYELDDDAVHVKIHLRDRLSQKFDKYNSGQKEALESHIKMHLARLQAAQAAAQAGGQTQNNTINNQPDLGIPQPVTE